MSYADIQLPEELQARLRVVFRLSQESRIATLGDLTAVFAKQTAKPRPENLISEKITRHQVTASGKILHTHCFIDALMLPTVLGEEPVEVRSKSPRRANVTARVTRQDVEASPKAAVVSFGAARGAEGHRSRLRSAPISTPSPLLRTTNDGSRKPQKPLRSHFH